MNTPYIWTDKSRDEGKPCLRNTSYPVAEVIWGLSEGMSLETISSELGVDLEDVKGALSDISNYFDNYKTENSD